MYIIIHQGLLAQVILLQLDLKKNKNQWVIKVGNKLNWDYVMFLS